MNLKEYLKADRQWPRHLRISHARFQLSKAVTDEDKTFWQSVLKANYRY